jgi:hypothetical protein
LESEHNSKSEQSASDNDLELVAGRNYWFYNLKYCFYCLSQIIYE